MRIWQERSELDRLCNLHRFFPCGCTLYAMPRNELFCIAHSVCYTRSASCAKASKHHRSEMDKLQQIGTNLSSQQCTYYLGGTCRKESFSRSRAGAEALLLVLRGPDGP